MPSTCQTDGAFDCAVSSIPWIIGILLVVLAMLAAARLALLYLERRRAPGVPPTAPRSPPKIVAPGSPLQPTPPQPKADKRQPQKPSPLQLRVADAPDLKVTDFANGVARADFGELLTDTILTGDGWKKLESKTGAAGIDGLYVREVKGGGGFEVLAVETKANEAAYDPASMSDEALERALSALYAQGAFGRSLNESVAHELIRGLRNGPPFFRKELWRHNLTNGVTAITQLGAAGEPKGSTMRSHARLVAGTYAALKQFDRGAIYLSGRPVDDGRGD
jgi:hypothetical protein